MNPDSLVDRTRVLTVQTRRGQPDLPAYAVDPEGGAWRRYRRDRVLEAVGWDPEAAPGGEA